jgi:hypothetical protein
MLKAVIGTVDGVIATYAITVTEMCWCIARFWS